MINIPPYGDLFRREGHHITTLKATPQPGALYVVISGGGFWVNCSEYVECAGGKSPTIVAPTSGSKWCLFYINSNGSIRIEESVASSRPKLPNCPSKAFPIAAAYVSAGDTEILPDKLFDIKGVFSTSNTAHDDLDGRDLPDAHTIDSITELRDILDNTPSYNDLENAVSTKADIVGTPFEKFTLNKDQIGVPLSNVAIEAERGTEPNVSIRWNESITQWEFTNNGVEFIPLSETTFAPATRDDLGGVIVGTRLSVDSSGILSADRQTDYNYTIVDKTKVDAIPSDLDILIASKVDKVAGKQLTTEDYTTTEKSKLAGLVNYVHPTNHDAGMIIEVVDKRFVTDAQKAKIETLINYVHPTEHPATMITEDSAHRFTSDAEKVTWNNKAEISDIDARINNIIGTAPEALDTLGELATSLANNADFAGTITTTLTGKVDKVVGKQLSTEDYTTAEKTKLSGLNNYVHPAIHSADIIDETVDHRFMTESEKSKLAAIEENANNYVHPVNHDAGMITEITDKRFMTDAERTKLADLVNYTHPTEHPATMITETTDRNWLTDAERTKLAGLANYTHPVNHPATMIVEDTDHRFVTDVEKSTWTGKAEISDIDSRINAIIGVAPEALDTLQELSASLGDDSDFAGTMTSALAGKVDKVVGMGLSENSFTTAEQTKLAAIEQNANNYVHPVSHAADMITETTDHNWLTDAERTKLAGLANYTHPSTHPATMIVEDTDHNFVTDVEKSTWNNKQTQLFISAEQVGTGAEASFAHGLGYIPTQVFISVTKTNGVSDWSLVEGVHTSTNILITATSGVNFKIMAY